LRRALAPGSTSKPNPSRAWSPRREPSPGRANTIRVAPRSPSHSRMASPTGRSTSRPSASRNVRTSVAWMPTRAATSSGTQESVDPVSTRRSHASLRAMSIEYRTTRACVIPMVGGVIPLLHRASPYMYIATDKRGPSAGSPRVPETLGRALDESAKALARAVFGDRPRRNGFKRDGLSARNERAGRPRLGWNIAEGVRRSARGPSEVLPTCIGRFPVDRVRLAPRDEPPPRPRRLREPDRRARPPESEPHPLGRARHGPRGRRPPRMDLLGQRGADRRANAHRTEDRGPPPVPLGRPHRLLALRAPGHRGDGHAGVVLGVPDRARRFPDEVPPRPQRHVPDLRSVDRRRGRVRGGPRAPR